MRSAVPAGLLDSAMSSLATFIIGLAAATQLPLAALGVYSLFFTAFLLATVVPAQLVFLPAEIAALAYEGKARRAIAWSSLPLGLTPAFIAAAATGATLALVPTNVPSDIAIPLATGAIIAAFLSPIQDHVRRILHLSGASWRATLMSFVQLAAAGGALLLLSTAGANAVSIPFTALGIANAASLSVGLLSLLQSARVHYRPQLHLGTILSSGRWLLLVGAAPAAAGLVVAAVVANISSAEALGRAEAARILAQPVLVISAGLGAVIQPRSMECGARQDRQAADRYAGVFWAALLMCSIAYAVLVGIPWQISPLPDLFPNAYAAMGLVAITILANTLNGVVLPTRSELLGARRERLVATIELGASLAHLIPAAGALWLHAYAKPLAFLLQGLARLVAFATGRRRVYEVSLFL